MTKSAFRALTRSDRKIARRTLTMAVLSGRREIDLAALDYAKNSRAWFQGYLGMSIIVAVLGLVVVHGRRAAFTFVLLGATGGYVRVGRWLRAFEPLVASPGPSRRYVASMVLGASVPLAGVLLALALLA